MARRDRRSEREARKLRDRATRALTKGKVEAALEAFSELEQLEPRSGDWSRRAADCHRRLGDAESEKAALLRAAERYSEAGFLLKAVAMCKLVLRIDPEHAETQAKLARLHSRRPVGMQRLEHATPIARSVPPKPAADGPVLAERPSLAPGTPLDQLQLSSSVPAPRRVDLPSVPPPPPGSLPPVSAPVMEIPIDEIEYVDDDAALELPDIEDMVALSPVASSDAPAGDAPDAAVVERDAHTSAWSEPGAATGAGVTEDVLRSTPLFSDVSEATLRRLIDELELVELQTGELLFRRGDPAHSMYVIAHGAVKVIAPGPPPLQLAHLEEGEFFGEVAIITDEPRTANVVAIDDTHLLVLTRETVAKLIDEEPGFLQVLLRFLRERLIASLVATSELFRPFAGGERRALASRFKFLEVQRDTQLIQQGKRSDGLFIMLSGSARVERARGSGSQELARLTAGDVFGEISLLGRQDAVASVRTSSRCFVLMLPAAEFRSVIMTHPAVLEYVAELAEDRKADLAALVEEEAAYDEGRVSIT